MRYLFTCMFILFTLAASTTVFAESIAGIDVSGQYAKIIVTGQVPGQLSAQISGVAAETSLQPLLETDIEVRTLFLIDINNSLSHANRSNIITILDAMIENKDTQEFFAIATFGDRYQPVISFTDDRFDLIRALDQVVWQGDGYPMNVVPALNAALQQVLLDSQGQLRFNQIVIFSDSRPGSMGGTTREELLFFINDANTPIHTVGFRYNTNRNELNDFYAFSRITGGIAYEFTTDSNVDDIVNILSAFVQDAHYVQVQLPPQFRDGTIRPIELVNQAGAVLLTYNLHMPLGDTPPPAAVKVPVPPVPPTSPEPVQDVIPDAPPAGAPSFLQENWLLIVIAAGVLLLVAGVVVFIARGKPKQKPERPQAPAPAPELENTMPMDDDDESETKPLIGEMPGHTPFLIMSDITQPQKRYEKPVKDTVEIGRKPNAPGITIDYDPKISRRHCAVKNRSGSLWIEDLGAVNKASVNDEVLHSAKMLKDNDVLTLGNTRFFVRIEKR